MTEEKQVFCMGEPVQILDADPEDWEVKLQWEDGTTWSNLSSLKADGGLDTIAERIEEVTGMTWDEFNNIHLQNK